MDFGVEIGERSKSEIALEVGKRALADFGRQEGELSLLRRAPLKRQELWRKTGVTPRGIDREVVETMHRTHMGVDQDYHTLLQQAMRVPFPTAGGQPVCTELQTSCSVAPPSSADNLGCQGGRGQPGHRRPPAELAEL